MQKPYDDDSPSKSQKKRDADALQILGKSLISLDEVLLQSMPLSGVLHQAIRDAKRIKTHGAIRRQIQYIGKLMRVSDHAAIAAAFAAIQAQELEKTDQFRATEAWRDKLIAGGAPAVTEFIDQYKPDDIQHLRQLIKKACSQLAEEQQKAARRALYLYIKPYL